MSENKVVLLFFKQNQELFYPFLKICKVIIFFSNVWEILTDKWVANFFELNGGPLPELNS